jgi:hypothetical protein
LKGKTGSKRPVLRTGPIKFIIFKDKERTLGAYLQSQLSGRRSRG